VFQIESTQAAVRRRQGNPGKGLHRSVRHGAGDVTQHQKARLAHELHKLELNLTGGEGASFELDASHVCVWGTLYEVSQKVQLFMVDFKVTDLHDLSGTHRVYHQPKELDL
jgi:hypothetical protein